jgi:Fe2+ transport system protein FeoA
MEFSLPLSQFPIIVPPNGDAPLKICYTPSSSEMQYDTIILRHDCLIINIPLSARGAVVSFEGRSRCDAVLSLRSLGFTNNSQVAMSASLPFPDPASNDIEFTLSFTEPTDKSNVIISVQDGLGMEVVTNQIEQLNSHQLLVQVRTASLAPSIYFARIQKGLSLLTIPFVVMH